MRISGIYQIQSKCNPKRIYIGSAKDIYYRWGGHLRLLRKNKHHSKKLQNHYSKYGESDLQFSILLGCNKEDLIKTEQYFLDSYHPYFNICKVAYSCLGIKRSAETNKKHSIAMKGKNTGPVSPERKLKCNHIGHPVTEEVKQKIRNTLIGKKHTEERRNNISKSLKGKKQTYCSKGIKLTEEHKKKISKSMTGKKRKPLSEELKKRLSIIHKERIEKKLKVA